MRLFHLWSVFCVSGAVAIGEYADTHLGRHLARRKLQAQELAAEYTERGCHRDKEHPDCQHIESRRLSAEWLTNATHRRLSCNDRKTALRDVQRNHNEEPDAEQIMKYAQWEKADCPGNFFTWDDLLGDERTRRLKGGFLENDASERRLQEWNGVQLAAGRPWPDRTFVYAFHPDINEDAEKVFKSAMKELEDKTCINFKEVPHGSSENYIELISSEDGCWANVGYGTKQQSNLASGCRWHGIALHEILHALGATHEQNRDDRDYFVKVDESVIVEESLHNFKKSDKAYTSIGYDYRSIMHYPRYAFSTNWWSKDAFVGWTLGVLASMSIDSGSPTIKSTNRRFVNVIGQRSQMSNNDLEQLLHMYQCEKVVLRSEELPGSGVSWNRGIVFSWGFEGVDIACSGGLAPTSCSCHQDNGHCRGAMLTSMSGGPCVAAGKKGSDSGLTGQAICHKFSSPHYMTARLSAEGKEGTASITCAGNYQILGCNCMTHEGDFCDATPNLDTIFGDCTVASSSTVTAQAVCVRAPALGQRQLVSGSAATTSEAVCPAAMELTGCSCAGQEVGKGHCAGAKATGNHSNTCTAYGHSGKNVIAHAICVTLLSNKDTPLPAAEHFLGGTLEQDGALAPVQTVYCDGFSFTPGTTGCKGISQQRREKAAFECESNCKSVDLTVGSDTVVVKTKKADGAARCPGNWVAVKVECDGDNCGRIKLTCATPPSEAGWFLSGGVSFSPFFSGETDSAMGTCGDALLIGVQCTDEAFFPTDNCQKLQLICRRVGIAAADDLDARASFDVKLLDGTWSNWVSSTGASEMIINFDFDDDNNLKNDGKHPIQSVQCRGSACDDLKFYLPKKFGSFAETVDLVGTPSVKTGKFDSGEMACPKGHFVVGMQCEGSFCEKKALMCAEPAGDKWLITGNPYYSFCFTNKAKMPWTQWYRDFKELVKGRSRLCVGTSYKDMPDKQSCGEDGILVGLKCYGDHCGSLQLMCMTITANVDLANQTIAANTEMKEEMISLNIYNDPQQWPEQPSGNQPASGLTWDGNELINDNLLLMAMTGGTRSMAECAMSVIVAFLYIFTL